MPGGHTRIGLDWITISLVLHSMKIYIFTDDFGLFRVILLREVLVVLVIRVVLVIYFVEYIFCLVPKGLEGGVCDIK